MVASRRARVRSCSSIFLRSYCEQNHESAFCARNLALDVMGLTSALARCSFCRALLLSRCFSYSCFFRRSSSSRRACSSRSFCTRDVCRNLGSSSVPLLSTWFHEHPSALRSTYVLPITCPMIRSNRLNHLNWRIHGNRLAPVHRRRL